MLSYASIIRLAHRLQVAGEGIENQAEILQCDDAKQSLVVGLAENNRGVAISLWQRDVTFGDLALDPGAPLSTRNCKVSRCPVGPVTVPSTNTKPIASPPPSCP